MEIGKSLKYTEIKMRKGIRKMKKKCIFFMIIASLVLSYFSIGGTEQPVYASSMSKQEKAVYTKVIEGLEKNYMKDYQSLVTEKYFAWGALDEEFHYCYMDIDKDGKKEMIVKVTYAYPCFMEDCFVFKYESPKKVKKIAVKHNTDSYSLGWPNIGLTSKYLVFYDCDWITQYDRKTLKKNKEYKVTESNNSYGAYINDNGNSGFSSNQIRNVKLKDKKSFSVVMGKACNIQRGTTISFHGQGSWSSSNKKVANVDKNGKVTPKKSGEAYIYRKINKNKTEVNYVRVF